MKQGLLLIFTSMLVILSCLYINNSFAEVYKYTDKSGNVHYVDDVSKIPEEYQDQAEDPHNLPNIIREGSDNPSVSRKSASDKEFEEYLAQITIAPLEKKNNNTFEQTYDNSEDSDNSNIRFENNFNSELSEDEQILVARMMKWGIPILIFFSIIALLQIISFWILLDRARMPGWGVLIPIYNLVLLSRLGGYSGWWILWNLVPFVGVIIWTFSVHYSIAINNNRSGLFAIGNTFLPFIFTPIMAFSKS